MKQAVEFKLRDGRIVQIVMPSLKDLRAITEFINRLSKEDIYLNYAGETYSLAFQKNWLNNVIRELKFGKSSLYWAKLGEKIVGTVEIRQGWARGRHVGNISLMVDKDFRRLGLGRHLLELILIQAKKTGYRIAKLNLFEENIIARSLYEKFGFKVYGCLPDGLLRQGKYSDEISMYKNL